jgi:hypothetical protein
MIDGQEARNARTPCDSVVSAGSIAPNFGVLSKHHHSCRYVHCIYAASSLPLTCTLQLYARPCMYPGEMEIFTVHVPRGLEDDTYYVKLVEDGARIQLLFMSPDEVDLYTGGV